MMDKCETKLKVLVVGTKRTCDKASLIEIPSIELIPFPVLDTKLLGDIHFAKDSYEWIILTSPAAVHHFANLSNKPSFKDVAVVGPSTNSAAEKEDIKVSFTPKGSFNAKTLCAELIENHPKIKSALFPCSIKADDTVSYSFEKAGLKVERVNLYEPVNLDIKELPDYNAIAFFSSSSVETFAKIYGQPQTKKIAAIGKKAAISVKQYFDIEALVPLKSTSRDTIEILL